MIPMRGARRDEQMLRDSEDRTVSCVVALYELSSRKGATRAKVINALKAEGFTPAEISKAAQEMGATL